MCSSAWPLTPFVCPLVCPLGTEGAIVAIDNWGRGSNEEVGVSCGDDEILQLEVPERLTREECMRVFRRRQESKRLGCGVSHNGPQEEKDFL